MALLEISNLAVSIGSGKNNFMAVNGIDMAVNAGEIVALAGESGCGKTMTALSVIRLLPPAAKISGGAILFQTASGETVNITALNEKSLRKIRGGEIAMIFQEPRQSLNPLMRIVAQIAETLELHGADKKTAGGEAMELLQRLRFPQPEKIFRSWPHQLSGGMCQRVMIAIAAVCRPRLLIADEPSSALDESTLNHCLDLLKQINAEFGTAILFISHDLSMAARFCSRMLVMYSGSIIEDGPADDVFILPLHPYTASLAGAIPRKENRGRPLAGIPGAAHHGESSGCAFAPRCYAAQERCGKEFPQWEICEPFCNGSSRRCRCFFPGAENG